jgi:serine/threonine protein kinase
MTREDPRNDEGSFMSALADERTDVTRARVPDPDAVLPAHVFAPMADRGLRLGPNTLRGLGDTPVTVGRTPAGAGAGGGASASRASTLADAELPEIGSIIDKYRVEDIIGTGGFAVVFRARHLMLDMPVAIKLLRPGVIRRVPAMTDALCEEARLAARINHPNVVRVHDVGHTPELTYIVMELIEGRTLAELIHRRGALKPSTVLRVGQAVALGLAAGLDEGIIHRDIKPANIVVTRTGGVKIVDLGLARAAGAGDWFAGDGKGLVGTPGYMAPEQGISPRDADFRADIYALGVTLYHATVGAPPYPIEDAARCMLLHQTAPLPLPSARLPGIPPALEQILTWMLAKDPADRPSSYPHLLAALRRAFDRIRD